MNVEKLFATPRKAYICNTNRKDAGGAELERLMLSAGYAATWTEFYYENDMQAVREGDLIFMYASKKAGSGGGFVAVGRALGPVEVLKSNPENDQRIVAGHTDLLGNPNSDEWRIPVEWLTQQPEGEVFLPEGYKALRATFWDGSRQEATPLDAEATLRAMLGEAPKVEKAWSSEDCRILLNEVISPKDDLEGQLRVSDALVEKLGRPRHQVEAILPKIESHLAQSGYRDEVSGQETGAPEALQSACDERIAELEVSSNTDAPIFKNWPDAEAANDDLNEYVQREVRIRKNLSVFRQRMLRAYGGKCAITGDGPEAALEAAHIEAHAKSGDNSDANGILLRADIHRLLDRDLIKLDQARGIVLVDECLRNTSYGKLHHTNVRPQSSS